MQQDSEFKKYISKILKEDKTLTPEIEENLKKCIKPGLTREEIYELIKILASLLSAGIELHKHL